MPLEYPATGLVYMQQRYYDPAIGRFLSVDPVTASSVNGGNFNRYWYANNNPYRFTDPDGRCPKGSTKNQCVESTVQLDGSPADVKLSPKEEKFALSNAVRIRVQSTGSSEESLTAVVSDASGKLTTRPLTDVTRSKSIDGETAGGKLPSGAKFVVHGHVRNSQLDQKGLGDSRVPLMNGRVNVTLEKRDVGAREIEGARLQHRMLRGEMSDTEADAVQLRLDAHATEYNRTH